MMAFRHQTSPLYPCVAGFCHDRATRQRPHPQFSHHAKSDHSLKKQSRRQKDYQGKKRAVLFCPLDPVGLEHELGQRRR
ncbi:hypothetical protein CGRA01v4_07018 [Colletotrichum graminicola]|nr:hypothetical protein CGRA01v4_07018 [Colletotrichum graminicola]